MIHEFNMPPRPGMILMYDGQAYEFKRVEFYTRKSNGRETMLLVWDSRCPECGASFQTATPFKIRSLTRRCEKHRARGKRIAPKKTVTQRRKK
ncbi:hypothetical protein [Agarilytica rhodophyticola]|uniref:hypothetical protein n=1 Tax=Agarilytica rhodophyticola TaxID=1737490 RepID=UPI000B349371|nr:hypothetical protein [Agarilytica rhodophyticola]